MIEEESYDQSNINVTCSCKGVRTCKLCEDLKIDFKFNKLNDDKNKEINTIEFMQEIIEKDGILINSYYVLELLELEGNYEKTNDYYFDEGINKYIKDNISNIPFDGVFTYENVFTNEEIEAILNELNLTPWIDSQSGRKKQDFASIKINYKKKKIKYVKEVEFPTYKSLIDNKLKQLNIEMDIKEIGNLLYQHDIGAHIEPHIDDVWIWGNKILGVNLLSNTVMTFSRDYKGKKYIINIPIPKNSLYLMSGSGRYDWKHEIKKENITSKRIVITCREYVPGIKLEQ